MGPVIVGHREQIRLSLGGRDVLTKAFQRSTFTRLVLACGMLKPDGVIGRTSV